MEDLLKDKGVLLFAGAHIRQVYALEMDENYLVETFKDVTELTIVVGLKRDADVADLMKTLPMKVLKVVGYDIEKIEKKDDEIIITCRKGRMVLSGGIMLHGWIEGFEGFIFWSEKFE